MDKQPAFRVQQIDHVELFVPDQYQAAAWYAEIFGLEILKAYEHWADGGPLMISSNGGGTMLALFKGQPPGERSTVGYRRVAFRVDAQGFLAFLGRLAEHPVYQAGRALTRGDVVDHGLSYSIYFNDPWGHPYEVTTYEVEGLQGQL